MLATPQSFSGSPWPDTSYDAATSVAGSESSPRHHRAVRFASLLKALPTVRRAHFIRDMQTT